MSKRTILLAKPMKVSIRLSQLRLELQKGETVSTPIEDISTLIVDHPQVIITTPALTEMLDANVNVIYCDDKHLPTGLLTPLSANYLVNRRARIQLEASLPLKKKLWQQTVKRKIKNQARLLKSKGYNDLPMLRMARQVKSGDTDNQEGQAARYYWRYIFDQHCAHFLRDRYGESPNMMLNYGYAILRAIVARALRGAGLLNIIGIHHHNQYNPYCLADDIMEPYRPYVDALVIDYCDQYGIIGQKLTNLMKGHMLQINEVSVNINKQLTTIGIAVEKTAYSLVECFEGKSNQILYPIQNAAKRI